MSIRISGSVGTGSVNTTTAPVDDNAIVRYDGTSGNNIQNSDITIDDSGNIQKISSGTVDLFTDGQATVITIGESGGTFNVDSGDYTIGSTGATGTVSGSDIVVGDGQPTDQIAIQAGTINIGQSGATVNIQGTTNYQDVTNLQVTDKLITVNKGGAASSGLGSGFEIEENSVITGYVKTSADRNSLEIKNPNQTGVASITLDSDNFTVDKTIVKGPTSGTDNKLVRTDGTNGRLIQESGITVNDTNDVSGVNSLSSSSISSPSITFGTASGILKATSGTVSATSITNSDVDASAGIVESKLSLDYSTSSLNSAIGTANTNLTNHINDTSGAHAASAISNTPTGNLAATDQQAVNNELQGDIDTINSTLSTATSNISTLQTNVGNLVTLSGVATNATDLGTFTGSTIADNRTNKQALQDLETAVESKASSSDLTTHTGSTAAHGATGAVVGTTNTQTLTNKTLTSPIINDGGIDLGTASSANFLKLPSDTKTNLDALTRAEGKAYWATDQNKFYVDDGTNLVLPEAAASFTVVTKTTNATLATSAEDIVLADSTSGNFTLTLPAASGNDGLRYSVIKTVAANVVTIDGNGSETIDGSTTVELRSQYDSIQIVCTGSTWLIENDDIVVAASYTSDGGQSNTTSEDVKEYEDLILDTHNAYNTTTGEYTVPVTGVYEAVHKIFLAAHTPASTNTNCVAAVYVDGTSVDSMLTRSGTTSSTSFGAIATMKARFLTKGQIVTCRASSSESIAMSTSTTRVGFEIKRVK